MPELGLLLCAVIAHRSGGTLHFRVMNSTFRSSATRNVLTERGGEGGERESAVKKEKETLFFRFLSPLARSPALCSAAEICFQPHSLRSLDAINRLRQFAPPPKLRSRQWQWQCIRDTRFANLPSRQAKTHSSWIRLLARGQPES